MRTALLLFAALALALPLPAAVSGPASLPPGPMAVVALIDSGINAYHIAFRDSSPLAFQHPCTYIVGYPCNATALPITLDAASYEEAYAADAALWAGVEQGELYWVPGTKIVGAIRFGSGGVNCPLVDIPPLNVVGPPPAVAPCPAERNLLDDHGHGTMTASRAAGNAHSLCPTCRIVEVEGLGAAGVKWAAEQGWIDVQSNSWLSLVPPPAAQLRTPGTAMLAACLADPSPACLTHPNSVPRAFKFASERMLTLAASGNGAGYIVGFAPTPTWALSTAAPGVILVGGHDNGRAALWNGAPNHVVADAYGGWAADHLSLDVWGPDPISCCTSAASPYAAGGAAQMVLDARELLGDLRTGVRDGVVAEGAPVPGSPYLGDGVLNLSEAAEVFVKTARPRLMEGPDDGLLNFAAEPRPPTPAELLTHGPGGNPFCQGCIAAPLRWAQLGDIPSGAQAPVAGYGAINPDSVAFAGQVLRGERSLPDTALADPWFALDAVVRSVFFVGV